MKVIGVNHAQVNVSLGAASPRPGSFTWASWA